MSCRVRTMAAPERESFLVSTILGQHRDAHSPNGSHCSESRRKRCPLRKVIAGNSAPGTDARNDGRTYYQFEVIIIAPDDVMRRITSVTYELEKAWPPDLRIRTVTDRSSRFKLKDLANGTSIVQARVDLRGQDRPVLLNRFIDLRVDGPRL